MTDTTVRKVTPEEVNAACVTLKAAGVDPPSATRGQIRKLCCVGDRRARTIREWIRHGTGVDSVGHVDTSTKRISFDEAYEVYRQWIGASSSYYTRQAAEAVADEKIVIAGDLHVPFQHMEAIQALVEEESADTTTLVLNGDLGDFWSTSRFPKSKRLVTPCEELAQAQAVLTLLAGEGGRRQS
jgi:hypothetical protein